MHRPVQYRVMACFVRRLCGCAVLVAFTSTLGLGLGAADHLGPADDADCAPVALSADHATTQFEAVKPSAPAGHCAFCHFQRAVGGARASGCVSGLFYLQLLDRPESSLSRVPSSTALDLHTSRGPPASIS